MSTTQTRRVCSGKRLDYYSPVIKQVASRSNQISPKDPSPQLSHISKSSQRTEVPVTHPVHTHPRLTPYPKVLVRTMAISVHSALATLLLT